MLRWDENKNAINRARHGISFETARLGFDDREFMLLLDQVLEGEVRWRAIGLVSDAPVTVVHTYPQAGAGNEDLIRIVSARKSTASERRVMTKKREELTPQQIEELDQLAALPDSEIDTTDIPEAEFFRHPARGETQRRQTVRRVHDILASYGAARTVVLKDEIYADFADVANRRTVSIDDVVNAATDGAS
jgi:uncharacterized protein